MVLTKWFVIKSGALQKRALFLTLVVVGVLFFIPMLATVFSTKSSMNWEIPWSLSLLAVIGICFFVTDILGFYHSKKHP